METRQMRFTKEVAASILEKNNAGNRPESGPRVAALAQVMNNGGWIVTHQGIAFSGDATNPGRLLDGQTRLSAFIASNLEHLDIRVTFGVPESAFLVMDEVRPRTGAFQTGASKHVFEPISFLANLHLGFDKKFAPQFAPYLEAFAPVAEMLTTRCTKYFSSCAVRAAFILHMVDQTKSGMAESASIYSKMVNRDYQGLSKAMCSAISRVDKAPFGSGTVGQIKMFTLFTRSIASKATYVQISDTTEVCADARLKIAMSINHPAPNL